MRFSDLVEPRHFIGLLILGVIEVLALNAVFSSKKQLIVAPETKVVA